MKRNRLLLLLVVVATTAAIGAFLDSSNVDPDHKFSWSENTGWWNWRDADGTGQGVFVGNDFLSGYIWGENLGWINVGDGMGPYANTTGLDFGVNVLAGGDLDGYAWSENAGWINLGWAASTADAARARFDSGVARFYGYAWSENEGWINLDDDTHYVGAEPSGPDLLPPDLPASPHDARKNRYITIDAATNGAEMVAYRVMLSSMMRCDGDDRRACIVDGDCPGVCAGDNDLQCTTDTICGPDGPCIVTAPCIEHDDVGMVAGYIDAPYTDPCTPLGDCSTQWFAELSSTPVYRVWTENAVHVLGCEIVPVAQYEVQATADEIVFSDPLTIGTIPKPHVHYADCVGPVVGGQYGPPDGFTNVTDVQAYLIAMQGGATAPHTTWVDVHGALIGSACIGADCIVPQQILNVGDLQTIKFGYLGQTYVETPGQENPADCP